MRLRLAACIAPRPVPASTATAKKVRFDSMK